MALLGCLPGIIYASSYPGDHPAIYTPKKIYPCNWAQNTTIRYYVYQLSRYQIKTVYYPYKLRIVIPDYVFFIPLTDVVTYHAQDPFYILAALLEQFPGSDIKITGYSDDIATQAYNQQDTLAKAQKLSGYLWMNNIPNHTQQLSYNGAGEDNPISSNQRVSGMSDNRRLEVLVSLPH